MKTEIVALWPQVAPFFYASLAIFVLTAPVVLLHGVISSSRRRSDVKEQ